MDKLEKFVYERLESEFMKDLFKATLLQLKYKGNPIRYNSFAFSFRELVRHVLHQLAPEDELKNCTWYARDYNARNGITRAQRIEYAVRGGLSNDFLNGELNINLIELKKNIKACIDKLSKYTHIEEEVFRIDENDGDKVVNESIQALVDFYKAIDDLKCNLINKYEDILFNIIDDIFSTETFNEIDILSTHHYIEEIVLDKVEIMNIDSKEIFVKIIGEVSVDHQYGSNSDVAKGNGVVFSSSYPFYVSKKINVLYPLRIVIDPNEIIVDNSRFFE